MQKPRSRRSRKLTEDREEIKSVVSEQSSSARKRTRSYILRYEDGFDDRRMQRLPKENRKDNPNHAMQDKRRVQARIVTDNIIYGQVLDDPQEDLDVISQTLFTPLTENKIKVRLLYDHFLEKF